MPHCAVTLFLSSQYNQHKILCARIMQDGQTFELQSCMLRDWSYSLLEKSLCKTVFYFSLLKNYSGTYTLYTHGYTTYVE